MGRHGCSARPGSTCSRTPWWKLPSTGCGTEDPLAWALLDGETQPRYTMWAYGVVGSAQDLQFPARMDLIEALSRPAGWGTYASGVSPYRRPFPWPLTGLLGRAGTATCSSYPRSPKRRAPGLGTGHGHRPAWLTTGLRRAARAVSADLPFDYTRRVAADGLGLCDQLGVMRLGHGVVLHTAPDSKCQLPVVFRYADRRCYRAGSRHALPQPSNQLQAAVAAVAR